MPMPEQAEEQVEEQIEGQEQEQQSEGQQQQQEGQGKVSQQQTIDWDTDENPYKKRYGDSQSQIQPLVRTLNQFAEYDHTTKSWKPKPQQQQSQQPTQQQLDDIDKALEGYDPEFVKVFKNIVSPIKSELEEFKKQRQESAFMQEYNSTLTATRNKVLQEFGGEFELAKNGKFNTDSPLYKLANEILTAKYAQFNPDGTFHRYTSADAEYMATVEAYAIIARRSKRPQPDKARLGAIQGKGSKSTGTKGNLSYEEYSKLSNEEKDAYDLSQVSG